MSIIYGLKVNLSVAMVAMLNHTAIQELSNRTAMLNHTAILASTNRTVLQIVQTVTNITNEDDSCRESTSDAAVEVNNLKY